MSAGVAVLAWAEELAGEPELLDAWARIAEPGITLVAAVPEDAPAALDALAAALAERGLAGDGGPDVLAVSLAPGASALAELAATTVAALSQVPDSAPGVPSFTAADGDALALLVREAARPARAAPQSGVSDARNRARAAAAAGDHVRAAELYELLRAVDPHDGEALAGLSLARLALGAASDAADIAVAALAAAPRSAAAHRAYGQACAAQGRDAEAAEALRTALALALESPVTCDETALQRARIAEYRALWSCAAVAGEAVFNQPVLLTGQGRIEFGEGVTFGWRTSPGYLSGYAYVEAAAPDSVVRLGGGCFFNNGVTLRSEGPGIDVGAQALFGTGVQVFDSDFHALDPAQRWGGTAAMGHVEIGPNAWIGSNAMILKGVVIGADTVVGAGAVVTRSLPAGVIAGGNPARVIRSL